MNANIELFRFINGGLSNPYFDFIMPQLTNVGGFAALLCICIIAVLVFRHLENEKYLKISKLCLYSLLVSAAIAACLKLGVAEERPFRALLNVNQLVVPTEPNSFPSGHTSSTFSVITVLVHELRENKLLSAILILFGVILAFSRVYCGVHYPLDVVVGAMVGIISGVLVLKVKF